MADVAFTEQRRQLPSPAPSPNFGAKNTTFTIVFTRQKTEHVLAEHRAPSSSVNAVKAELRKRQVHFNVNEIGNVREIAAYEEGGEKVVYFYGMAVPKAREVSFATYANLRWVANRTLQKVFQAAIRKLSSLYVASFDVDERHCPDPSHAHSDLLEDSRYVQLTNGSFGLRSGQV